MEKKADWHHFYKTSLWVNGRRIFLAANPLCERCRGRGEVSVATVVHHRIPHKGSWAIFKNVKNWAPSCKRCHDAHEQNLERLGYEKGVGSDGWPTDGMHPLNRRKRIWHSQD